MSFAFNSAVAPSRVAIRVAVQSSSCGVFVCVRQRVFVWCQEVCSYWAQISIIAVINGLNETQLGRGGKWFLTQPVLNKILFTVFYLPPPPPPPLLSLSLLHLSASLTLSSCSLFILLMNLHVATLILIPSLSFRSFDFLSVSTQPSVYISLTASSFFEFLGYRLSINSLHSQLVQTHSLSITLSLHSLCSPLSIYPPAVLLLLSFKHFLSFICIHCDLGRLSSSPWCFCIPSSHKWLAPIRSCVL